MSNYWLHPDCHFSVAMPPLAMPPLAMPPFLALYHGGVEEKAMAFYFLE
jgi:hypothetical protein